MLITETKYAILFTVAVETFGSPFTQLFFLEKLINVIQNGKIGE